MQILFSVDQRAALLRGVNAPASTVRLDIDPASISERERLILAAILMDGHDATRRTLKTQVAGYEGNEWHGSGASYTRYTTGAPLDTAVILHGPTLDDARDALIAHGDAKDAAYATYLAAQEKKCAKAREDVLAIEQSSPVTDTMTVAVIEGKIVEYEWYDKGPRTTLSYSYLPYYYGSAYDLSPADATAYHRMAAEREAAKKAAQEAAIATATPAILAAHQACVEAAAAKAAAEKEAAAKHAAEAARCRAQFIRALEIDGTPAQKEMRKRGLMTDSLAAGYGRKLMEDAAFAGSPLARFTAPNESDIDTSEWLKDHPDTDQDDMPEIVRDQHVITSDDCIASDVMESILAAEVALREWAPIISATPILARIARDHSDIPWSEPVYGVRVMREWKEVVLTRYFELPR